MCGASKITPLSDLAASKNFSSPSLSTTNLRVSFIGGTHDLPISRIVHAVLVKLDRASSSISVTDLVRKQVVKFFWVTVFALVGNQYSIAPQYLPSNCNVDNGSHAPNWRKTLNSAYWINWMVCHSNNQEHLHSNRIERISNWDPTKKPLTL